MSRSRPSARAIIEGHHHDPFNYLGWHHEDDEPVVRVFLPDAIAGQGARRRRRTSANCRASTTPGCSPARSPRATRTIGCARASATTRSSWRTPTAFRRSCPTSTCICSAKARICELYDKLGAHPMRHRRRRRRGVRGVRAERAARQRGRRLQFLGRPPPRHAGARQRLLGNLRPGRRAPATNTNTRSSVRDGAAAAAQVRSGRVRRRGAALDRVDRGRCRTPAAAGAARARRQRAVARRCRSTRCISARGGASPRRATAG